MQPDGSVKVDGRFTKAEGNGEGTRSRGRFPGRAVETVPAAAGMKNPPGPPNSGTSAMVTITGYRIPGVGGDAGVEMLMMLEPVDGCRIGAADAVRRGGGEVVVGMSDL